jgi:hypothetical protein
MSVPKTAPSAEGDGTVAHWSPYGMKGSIPISAILAFPD